MKCQLFLAILIVWTSCADILRVTELSQLQFDENARLSGNYLLYSDNPACKTRVVGAWAKRADNYLRILGSVSGQAAEDIFGSSHNPLSCQAVCLGIGTLNEHVKFALPEQIFNDSKENSMISWIQGCQSVEIGFVSYVEHECTVYWIDHEGERIDVGTLGHGEKHTVWQTTTIGHKFEVEDSVTHELLGNFTVQHHAFHVIGELSSGVQENHDVIRRVERTFQHEWDRAHRVKRTYTELGFAKGRLPTDLYASLSSYYYNNRASKVREEWDSKGLFVNWWEVDVFMIGMPWQLKKYWQGRLKYLVEQWSGAELELTDIYGMRQYEDGARLLTHVDREETHALSLIINVAQGEMRQPWAVEIYDHADRLHEVIMEPGDIVYYESARCLHGRMNPLEGGFYVNLFAHYRPSGGDSSWFKKPNPAGSTRQLLDIGDCWRSPEDASKVHCSKGFDLPSLSPALETLHGPNDLFRWWKTTTPSRSSSFQPILNSKDDDSHDEL